MKLLEKLKKYARNMLYDEEFEGIIKEYEDALVKLQIQKMDTEERLSAVLEEYRLQTLRLRQSCVENREMMIQIQDLKNAKKKELEKARLAAVRKASGNDKKASKEQIIRKRSPESKARLSKAWRKYKEEQGIKK